MREGLAFHRALPEFARDPRSRGRLKHRPGFNLLARFKTFKDDVLRFLVDFDVPFTNNLAEQDIRMTKVKMKISGAFRTLAGQNLRLRLIVSTARKQGCDILQTLAVTPDQISQPPRLTARAWDQGGGDLSECPATHSRSRREALCDLFGAPALCPASLTAWVGEGPRSGAVYVGIGARVAREKVRHLDETGLRAAGRLHWLHTTSSAAFTFYRAEEKRSAIPSDLKGGVIVHDGSCPRSLGDLDHALPTPVTCANSRR